MKPILYDCEEITFRNNGIGVLRDTISCVVTEERNGTYELELEYPIDGQHYEKIALRKIIVALPNNNSNPQPFRIFEISKPIAGIVTVYAQHIAYDLRGIPVAPFQATNAPMAMMSLKTNAVVDCQFEFWTDKETTAKMTVDTPKSIWELLGGTSGGILDVYGGEYEFDVWTVKLHKERGYNRGVTIRYGKNLTDLRQDENCENVYTGVYPYWSDSNGNLVELDEKVVYAPGNYSFERIKIVDFSQEWTDAPSQEELQNRAEKYIRNNNIGTPKISLTVSFAPIEQASEYENIAKLQKVNLCDTVSVEFPKLNVSATAECVATKFDVLTERYESVELGNARSNFVDTIVSTEQEMKNVLKGTYMRQAIISLTSDILGANGGSVRVIDTDNDGVPDTLYIADDPDVKLAKKVWRFNYEGWGASENGYNGPFTLGASFNTGILADFITAGTLNASLIKLGTLSDKKGVNCWDMETGVLTMNAGKIATTDTGDIAIEGNIYITGNVYRRDSETDDYTNVL